MGSREGTPIFTEKFVAEHLNEQNSEATPELTEVRAKLQVSQTFQTCEEAFDAYKLYARLSGFGVRIQRCYRRRGEGGEIIRKDFVCHRANTPNTMKEAFENSIQRRNRMSCRCKCPANLRVSVVNVEGTHMWHVVQFIEDHNHDLLTSNEVRHLRGHRYMSVHCKNRISELAECNVSVRQILSVIATEQNVQPSSLPFNAKDVHNYLGSLRRRRRSQDASELIVACLNFQKNDADFKFEFEVDSENRLMHIAWSHASSFRAYKNYGDVVLFDTTYKLNMYEMPVGIWVGVSNFGSTCFFGCCLLRDEKTVSFEWAFKAFLKLMNGKAPLSIMTDQDLAMKDAIRNVFPDTKHGLCMWHIAKKFPSYLRSALKERYDAWKDRFWSLTRLETIGEFESAWESHLEEFGLQENDHLKDLYEEREKWAMPYVRSHFFAGISTTGRSEAMNASLKRFVKKQVNLADFIAQVTGAVGLMDNNGELLMTKHIVDNIKIMTSHPIERQAADLLTPYAFNKYQAQIISSFSYAAFIVDINLGLWLVRRMDTSTGGRSVQHMTTETIRCSCRMFEFEGLLCRHALAVLFRCNAFETPKDYIPFRWSRAASVRLPTVDTGVEPARSRTEMLQSTSAQLMREASTSEAMHNWVAGNLSMILDQAQSNVHGHNVASQSRPNVHSDEGPVELPLTLNGHSAVYPIQTPPSSNPKGRKKSKRVRGILENNQRPRKCRVPGCGATCHDRRNCPIIQQGGSGYDSTQSTIPDKSASEGQMDADIQDSDFDDSMEE